VVEAKAGAGSATLSMAYAAARMAESTLLGLQGEPNMWECAFVASDVSAVVSCTPPVCSCLVLCPSPCYTCPDTPPPAPTTCTAVPQVVPGCAFFASRVQLGPEGIAKVNGLGGPQSVCSCSSCRRIALLHTLSTRPLLRSPTHPPRHNHHAHRTTHNTGEWPRAPE
jgi:hypothetical protein